MSNSKHICPWCYFARTKKDTCGVYCTGGLENPDGTCDRFIDCYDRKAIKRFKEDADAKN